GDAIDPPEDGLIGTIPPRTRVRGIVRLLDPERVGTHVTFAMSEPHEKRPVQSERVRVWDLTPLLEDPPDENVGKVTLGLMGTCGAMWIPTPEALRSELDATSVTGFGMRLGYGLHKRFNFEAEAVYASTGQAQFGDDG